MLATAEGNRELRLSGAFGKRMKGLEPSTFCMASARDVRTRSRPCAQSAMFAGSSSERANASEPERTSILAILATPRSGSEPHPSQLHHDAGGICTRDLASLAASSERTLAHAGRVCPETGVGSWRVYEEVAHEC